MSAPIPNKMVTLNYNDHTIYKEVNDLILDEIHMLIWSEGLKVCTIATDVLLQKYPILKEYMELQELAEELTNKKQNFDIQLDKMSDNSFYDSENSGDDSIIFYNRYKRGSTITDSYISDTDDSDTNIETWIKIEGYDKIKKKIILPGIETLRKPVNGDICIINVIGAFENGEVLESYFNHRVCVGFREISKGLDLLLKTMNVDECIRAKVAKKYLYDHVGERYNLKSAPYIFYTVKLLSVERRKKDFYNGLFEYHRLDNIEIVPTNERSILQRFLTTSIGKQKKLAAPNSKPTSIENKIKTNWYDEITLEAFAKDPINTYIKIGIAEMIMHDYSAAYKTLNYVIENNNSNLQAIYLRDIIKVLKQKLRIREEKYDSQCYSSESDSEYSSYIDSDYVDEREELLQSSIIPYCKYCEIKNMKEKMNIENLKIEKASFTSIILDKVIWVLALGISTVTISIAIKKCIK